MQNKPWTSLDIKYLYEHHLLGDSFSNIAKHLGRTSNACNLKIRDTDWIKNGYEKSPENHNKKWTKEDCNILYSERLLGTDYKKISRMLSRTYHECKLKYRMTDWKDYPLKNEAKEKARQAKYKALERETEHRIEDSLEKFKMRADIVADKMSQVMERYPLAPLFVYDNKKSNKFSPEDMGLMLSDLHVGQETLSEELGGIGSYSIDIFKKRMKNLQFAIADIYNIHTKLYKLPTLHIFCLGDIVQGMNTVGAWGFLHIETPILDQFMIAFDELSRAIFYWLSMFDSIKFYGVRGNHGRISPSGLEKDYNNWDNLMYEMLRLKFENNPRIEFEFSKTPWVQTNIQNHNFFLVHGDDVKSKNGFPIRGLLDFMHKMSGLTGIIPDYTLAGHFHNAAELDSHRGEVIINGSFVGADPYSIKNYMPGTRAIQKLFGIHKERGLTWRYNIDLDVERNANDYSRKYKDICVKNVKSTIMG